ncbi:MAG: M14 family metallopeptidase [Gammaproteobacteria bacterium]|nr:M14 family metallopeptidase [Gammaproteobacteria bacterium]
MLTTYDHLPTGLLELEANQLQDALPGPSLIHLPGKRPQPLFVSVLMHGNEVTGWQAVRELLRKYQDRQLPRALSLLIGNVAAAQQGQRHLPEQPDYNRIWKGEGDGPEQVMVRQVLEAMRARRPYAAIDVHNNTGLNPHYACVNRLDTAFLQLANLFSRTVVYFLKPDSVLSMAFAAICPAVTIECGRPGEPHGTAHVMEYLDACLHLSDIPAHEVAPHDLDLFHTVAIVKVPPQVSIGQEGEVADLCLPEDLDHLNFRELAPGTVLGLIQDNLSHVALQATNERGEDVSERYFAVSDAEIRTRIPVMPSMLTMDTRIIRQDCLCYLMERLDLQTARQHT